jgi:hypothetical protein
LVGWLVGRLVGLFVCVFGGWLVRSLCTHGIVTVLIIRNRK